MTVVQLRLFLYQTHEVGSHAPGRNPQFTGTLMGERSR
jgi:hypothetical protein